MFKARLLVYNWRMARRFFDTLNIIDSLDLSAREHHILSWIAARSGDGKFLGSIERIVKCTGVSKSTAKRSLATLEHRKLLYRQKKLGRKDVIVLTLPTEVKLTPPTGVKLNPPTGQNDPSKVSDWTHEGVKLTPHYNELLKEPFKEPLQQGNGGVVSGGTPTPSPENSLGKAQETSLLTNGSWDQTVTDFIVSKGGQAYPSFYDWCLLKCQAKTPQTLEKIWADWKHDEGESLETYPKNDPTRPKQGFADLSNDETIGWTPEKGWD